MENNIVIYFFTSDGYSDCWNPFFTLFVKYWPNFKGKIYMSTEYKDYSFENLNIIPLKVSQKHNIPNDSQPKWGQRMLWALEEIREEVVIMLQEDFFLNGNVDNDKIHYLLSYMYSHKNIRCIHFTPINVLGSEFTDLEHSRIINFKSTYRVSAQPAFWRTEELVALIRPNYIPWQFEFLGSRESSRQKNTYLFFDKKYLESHTIYPFIMTGITKGQWNKDVVPLFEANNIHVNYEIRGFYKRGSMIKRILNALKLRYKILIGKM